MEDLEKYLLGETDEIIEFDSRLDNLQIAAYMAMQAKRSIRIFSPDLEPAIYDNETFISAIRTLATRSRFSSIQIIVQNSNYIIKHGHRLIELARRFTSFIHLHNPPMEHMEYKGSFLIVDQYGYIQKKVAERNHGAANFNGPLITRDLNKLFDEIWEKSSPDQDLRRIHI